MNIKYKSTVCVHIVTSQLHLFSYASCVIVCSDIEKKTMKQVVLRTILFGWWSVFVSASSSPSSSCDVGSSSCSSSERIFVKGQVLDYTSKGGIIVEQQPQQTVESVYGCCSSGGTKIGEMVQMTEQESLGMLRDAKQYGWQGGIGEWPQMSLKRRIECVLNFVDKLKEKRSQIIQVLMHEIGKTQKDAASEFDRTMEFIQQVIQELSSSSTSQFTSYGKNVRALVQRTAIGIVLCLGPYNYPLNETYAAMIPALLMGNIVILKLPTVGGLVHILTMEAILESFPPYTINLLSGKGRETMPPLMKTGDIDALAFIGGSNAADKLIKAHPHPHKLKLFLQLEAKNMGIFLKDAFTSSSSPSLTNTMYKEAIAGALSYNGQRCTALKLFFVPKPHGMTVAKELSTRVEKLTLGMPWDDTPDITPLPNQKRIDYMKELIDDAVKKGATIMNDKGGTIHPDGPYLMVPAVLYPVTKDMRIYTEEQFGPIVPIVEYEEDDYYPILEYATEGNYAQQVSIFTSGSSDSTVITAELIDFFRNIFGKININSQCSRSPDVLPFSGRRSSAMGVMSISNIINEFSVPTVISYKDPTLQSFVEESIPSLSSFIPTTSSST